MKRSEFIKLCSVLGVGIAISPTGALVSCQKEEFNVVFNGSVTIIGGGAAGMTAAYILSRHGVNVTLVEAGPRLGGRVRKLEGFADFPIDTGAEWIHTNPAVFGIIMDDPNAEGSVATVPYNPETTQRISGGEPVNFNLVGELYGELKFKDTTWYDFFEDYVVPKINGNIILNNHVTDIDSNGSQCSITLNNGTVINSDKVICTVSTEVLKANSINFSPTHSNARQNALENAYMPNGIKVFLKFNSRFYPDLLMTGDISSTYERTFYDVAFKKISNYNVFGLFTIGDGADELVNLGSDQEIVDKLIAELDGYYNGAASSNLFGFHVQNWTQEQFVRGSYTYFDNGQTEFINAFKDDGKLYFSGEAFSEEAQATVHGAALHGMEIAKKILTGG